MGFAVAAEAARRGCATTLVAGPVDRKTPKDVVRVDVVSARDMLAAVLSAVEAAVAAGEPLTIVSTAAIADWRPAVCASRKLKKDQMSGVLKLVRNPDILKTVNARRRRLGGADRKLIRLVGFAAETNDVLAEASRKCRAKGLEFIVANDVTQKGCGFGTETNKVTFAFPDGSTKDFPLMTKRRVAKRILDEVLRP